MNNRDRGRKINPGERHRNIFLKKIEDDFSNLKVYKKHTEH